MSEVGRLVELSKRARVEGTSMISCRVPIPYRDFLRKNRISPTVLVIDAIERLMREVKP